MQFEINAYLQEVKSHLHLDPRVETKVILELYTYFQEKVAELSRQGCSEEVTATAAIKSFGTPRAIARLMYEAYSRGTWIEALITSQPHFLAAAMFAFHLWPRPLPLSVAFISIVGITLVGWWHGKPNWLCSWMGYALLPLILGIHLSRRVLVQTAGCLLGQQTLPVRGWALVLLVAFSLFSAWVILSTIIRVIRRDWPLASLMLVPMPVFWIWSTCVENSGDPTWLLASEAGRWDSSMALVFIIIGVVSAIFVRVRQRLLKAAAATVAGIASGTIVAHSLWGNLRLFSILVLSLALLILFVSPAILESICTRGASRNRAKSSAWIESTTKS